MKRGPGSGALGEAPRGENRGSSALAPCSRGVNVATSGYGDCVTPSTGTCIEASLRADRHVAVSATALVERPRLTCSACCNLFDHLCFPDFCFLLPAGLCWPRFRCLESLQRPCHLRHHRGTGRNGVKHHALRDTNCEMAHRISALSGQHLLPSGAPAALDAVSLSSKGDAT